VPLLGTNPSVENPKMFALTSNCAAHGVHIIDLVQTAICNEQTPTNGTRVGSPRWQAFFLFVGIQEGKALRGGKSPFEAAPLWAVPPTVKPAAGSGRQCSRNMEHDARPAIESASRS